MTENSPVPFFRQVCAFVYDFMLIISFIILEGFVFLAINKGQVIAKQTPLFYCLQTTIIATPFLFYAFFWSRQSQTLGMRAWRLVLVNQKGKPPSFFQALLRSFLAGISLSPLLIGGYFVYKNQSIASWFIFLFCGLISFYTGHGYRKFNRNQQTLYDQLAKTSAYLVAKNPYHSQKRKK